MYRSIENVCTKHGSHSDWKTLKNGRAFSGHEILPKILEKAEKIQLEKSTGKVRETCQPVLACEKYWKRQGNLSVRKVGTMTKVIN